MHLNFSTNKETLDAPLVEFEDNVGVSTNTNLEVVTDGCEIICNDANLSDYCTNSSIDFTFEWIEAISINGVSNLNIGGSSYSNFTNISLGSILPGDSVDYSITPGFSNTAYQEYFSVWIDSNFDDVFDNSELVISNSSNSTIAGKFAVPNFVENGTTILRVQINYDSGSDACGSFQYGETEDYKINLGSNCN